MDLDLGIKAQADWLCFFFFFFLQKRRPLGIHNGAGWFDVKTDSILRATRSLTWALI